MPANGKVKKIKKSRSFIKKSGSSRDSGLSQYILNKSQENILESSVKFSRIPEEGVEIQLDNSFNSFRKQLNDIKQQNLEILHQFATLEQDIDNMRYIQESQYYYQCTNLVQEDNKATKHTKTPSLINSSCSSLLSSNSSSESFGELFDENMNSPIEAQPTIGFDTRREKPQDTIGTYNIPTKYNTLSRINHKHQRSNSSDEDQSVSRPSSATSGSINEAIKRRNPPIFRRSSSIRCGFSTEVVSKLSQNQTNEHVTCL
ncbi:hypothetical protein LOD99_6955 [Oopsacas minuta]|uniref:Uncharacterized protein n=1 Tax=Oopsacas minuta TaxID=111878 RepID=A0AAV7JJC6_9METZ|nr:hypothetical protein LOD99_6955 [Oopsacas minuta]